ncbi:MAG: DUF1659 domain-containing protein [Syntrophomonadaceae bacterium]
MAVVATPVASNLLLIMDAGLDEYGQQLTRKRQFSNLKTSASDEDVFQVAAAIISLQEAACLAIQRVNTVELTEEG